MRFTTARERSDTHATSLLEAQTVHDVPTSPLGDSLPCGAIVLDRQADLLRIGGGEVQMVAFAPARRGLNEGAWWRFADVVAITTPSSMGPSTKVTLTDRQSGFSVPEIKVADLVQSGWRFRTLTSDELKFFEKTPPKGLGWDPYTSFAE